MAIMIKIYFIVDINGLVYVGATIQELKYRFSKHKSNKKRNYGCCSSQILDLDNSIIECIEECTEDERREREKYWIDNIDCVNIITYDFDKKEYRKEYQKEYRKTEKYKEYNKEYQKEYRAKNRGKIKENKKEYMKEYRKTEKNKEYRKEYYQKNKLVNSN